MYGAIDIGGTKTLVAVFDKEGRLVEQQKFSTPQTYKAFCRELYNTLSRLKHHDFKAVGVGVPARLNRDKSIAIAFGNLDWLNIPIQSDIERLVDCPVIIENDVKAAAVSEAKLFPKYSRLAYISISTGIGVGVTVDGVVDPALENTEIRGLEVNYRGRPQMWESFASGKAIIEQFGQRAEVIKDEKSWAEIAHNLALGLIDLIAIIQPDVIVFGGGVGQYFKRFEKPLETELRGFENAMMPIPPLRLAQRPNEAVIYGCYELARSANG